MVAEERGLLPGRPVIALMVAGFVLGFALYLIIVPASAQMRISIADVLFHRDDDLIDVTVVNEEAVDLRCAVALTLTTGLGQEFRAREDASIVAAHSSKVVSIAVDIPDSPFDYGVDLECTSLDQEQGRTSIIPR